jgi:hypothetical protein
MLGYTLHSAERGSTRFGSRERTRNSPLPRARRGKLSVRMNEKVDDLARGCIHPPGGGWPDGADGVACGMADHQEFLRDAQ